MKLIKILAFSLLLVGPVLFYSCSKDLADPVATVNKDLGQMAFLKVYNAAINTSRNHVFIDNSKITGTPLATGGIFPSGAFYATFPSGTRNLVMKDTLATTTQNVISLYSNFDAGKNYTLFLYDSTNAVKQKMVTDVIEVPADTMSRIRFANFVYSSSAVPNVDVYSYGKGANVFTNIAYGQVTDFILHPPSADSFFVRPTGTTTNLAKIALTPGAKRSQTLVFRGQYQATSGALARTLSSFTTY